MANRTKSESDRAGKAVNYRIRPALKKAIDEMVRRRAAVTGDDNATSWFIALCYKEAASLGIQIDPPGGEVPPAEAKPSAKKKSKR